MPHRCVFTAAGISKGQQAFSPRQETALTQRGRQRANLLRQTVHLECLKRLLSGKRGLLTGGSHERCHGQATNHRSLTLNLGVRWAYFAAPYESNGLMPLPVGGGNGIWGYSGSSWADWMKSGQRGDLMAIELVGKNSPHSGTNWYPNDWNNVGPAVGFAWQVPWFGEGKTTVRGGYQITYQLNQSGNNIIQEINVEGPSNGVTYSPSSADTYLDIARLPSLVPVPPSIKWFLRLGQKLIRFRKSLCSSGK